MLPMEQHDPSIPQQGLSEYGKTRDEYWNNRLFMEHMEVAVRVAEAKYPPRAFSHIWILTIPVDTLPFHQMHS